MGRWVFSPVSEKQPKGSEPSGTPEQVKHWVTHEKEPLSPGHPALPLAELIRAPVRTDLLAAQGTFFLCEDTVRKYLLSSSQHVC